MNDKEYFNKLHNSEPNFFDRMKEELAEDLFKYRTELWEFCNNYLLGEFEDEFLELLIYLHETKDTEIAGARLKRILDKAVKSYVEDSMVDIDE